MNNAERSTALVFLIFFMVLFVVFFRNSLAVLFGEAAANFSLLLLFFLSPYALFIPLDRKFGLLLSAYFLYLFVHLVVGLGQGLIYPLVGFFNLSGPLLFLITIYLISPDKGRVFKFGLGVFIVFALINALGALVQMWISINIFGLIENDIYANEELMSGGGIQKRAISFITSPQSLSLTLSFATALVVYCWPKDWSIYLKFFCLLLIVVSGALTISKAYFVFLAFVFIFTSVNKASHLVLFSFAMLIMAATGYFDRIFLMIEYLGNIDSYPAYQHWIRGFQHIDSATSLLFGKGIGFYSRGGQIIGGSDSIVGVESFLIQVFCEVGIVGFTLFLFICAMAFFCLVKRNRFLSAMFIAFLVVGIFTPAPYGFVVGIQLYFLVATGLFAEKIDFVKLGFRK